MTSAQGPDDRPEVPPGAIRLGQLAGVDVHVRTSWLFIAALIAITVAPRVEDVSPGLGALKYVAGLAFAVLLYLSILLHEVAHTVAARRYGVPVKVISVHFLGAGTELLEDPKAPRAEFVIALVGPLASIGLGVLAWFAFLVAPDGLLSLTCELLAVSNIALGVLNLVPGFPLDGGRMLRAVVWGATGNSGTGLVAAGWGGRAAALLILGWPVLAQQVFGGVVAWTDIIVALAIGVFLWGAAGAAINEGTLRRRVPDVNARELARPLIVVPADLSVAEAIRRAQEAGVGGIAIHTTDDRISGLVDEYALANVPDGDRPWRPVGDFARRLEDGMRVPVDAKGEEVIKTMQATPASEYLVVDPEGRAYGLLVTTDVNAVLRRGYPSRRG